MQTRARERSFFSGMDLRNGRAGMVIILVVFMWFQTLEGGGGWLRRDRSRHRDRGRRNPSNIRDDFPDKHGKDKENMYPRHSSYWHTTSRRNSDYPRRQRSASRRRRPRRQDTHRPRRRRRSSTPSAPPPALPTRNRASSTWNKEHKDGERDGKAAVPEDILTGIPDAGEIFSRRIQRQLEEEVIRKSQKRPRIEMESKRDRGVKGKSHDKSPKGRDPEDFGIDGFQEQSGISPSLFNQLNSPGAMIQGIPSAYRVNEPTIMEEEIPSAYRVDEPANMGEKISSAHRVEQPAIMEEKIPSAYRGEEPTIMDSPITQQEFIKAESSLSSNLDLRIGSGTEGGRNVSDADLLDQVKKYHQLRASLQASTPPPSDQHIPRNVSKPSTPEPETKVTLDSNPIPTAYQPTIQTLQNATVTGKGSIQYALKKGSFPVVPDAYRPHGWGEDGDLVRRVDEEYIEDRKDMDPLEQRRLMSLPFGSIVRVVNLTDQPDIDGKFAEIRQFHPLTDSYDVLMLDDWKLNLTTSVKQKNLAQRVENVTLTRMNMVKTCDMNGWKVTLVEYLHNIKKYVVSVDEGIIKGHFLKLTAQNVILPPDTRVKIHGLQKRTHLNGKWGKIVGWVPNTHRYEVDLGTEAILVRPEKALAL